MLNIVQDNNRRRVLLREYADSGETRLINSIFNHTVDLRFRYYKKNLELENNIAK